MIRGYSDKKAEIRREIMGRAPEITKSYMAEASCKIRNAVFGSPLYREAESVFLFISMWNEPDTKDILSAALNDGKRVYVPKCCRNHLMHAVRFTGNESFSPGVFGVPEPDDDSDTVTADELGLILVPCVAASLNGSRLGHGAGYYDMYLKDTKTPKLCLCFKKLLHDNIPMMEFDVFMDYIVTEDGIHKCR
jgi:5-formyltetrahydrofolate cyclo-ligase